MKLVLTSYYGGVDYDTLESLIGKGDDFDALMTLVDDGPELLFDLNHMKAPVEIVERLKNSADSLTVQTCNNKYVFKLVEIPDDVDDVVFDCDYGED